jgi:hypothetical protein
MAKSKEVLLAELMANPLTNPALRPAPQPITAAEQPLKGGNVRLPPGAMKLARALAKETKRSVPMAIYELLEANAKKNRNV